MGGCWQRVQASLRLLILACGGRGVLASGAGVVVLVLSLGACSIGDREARGDLQELVEELVSTVPGREEGGYREPTDHEARVLGDAVRAARNGDLVVASALVDPLGLEVTRFRDSATDRVLLVVRERRQAGGSAPRGWGLYVIEPRTSSRMIVEVPHPVADADTEDLGVAAFRAGSAGALLVAGAHRAATPDADVAHQNNSAFEVVHGSLVAAGTVVLQPHGFDGDDHPSGYGDAVVSDGEEAASGREPSRATAAVAAALSDEGFAVCLQHEERCSGLAATRNVQGRSTRRLGGSFVHLEVEAAIRADRTRGQRLAEVAGAALRPCSRVDDEHERSAAGSCS